MKAFVSFSILFGTLVSAVASAAPVTNRWMLQYKSGTDAQRLFLDIAAANRQERRVFGRTTCVANSRILYVVPDGLSDKKFLGTVVVELTSNCQETADLMLNTWKANPRINVYADGRIEPMPVVSGSTGRH